MFHIILHEPEIPPNAGNVMRLCANTGARLHLVRPLGFSLDAKRLRRAGLDYRDLAAVEVHADFAACRIRLGSARLFAVESGAPHRYADVAFHPGDAFVFGSETRGLPRALLDSVPTRFQVALPMLEGNRSLNLANAVAVVAYEAWRQNGFRSAAAIPSEPRGS
ncbi:MAG TPA: tRNA (cytidine(34)-2'-O)-methyltransferase [Steroidobacteraceae bacterium]|nr:tRNA (cytidine(34)-2'-O)-methyltransferase [Steroidobacteraceae bacterium]